MRKLRFDLLLLAASVGLFLPARAQAQWFRVCGSTWTNTCSVVNAQAYKVDPNDPLEPWKLRITWKNVSPAGLEGENSVGTRMLINVRDWQGNPLFSEDLSVQGGDLPPPDPTTGWENWELGTKKKGNPKTPYAFNMIGWEGWTGEINNTDNKGDGGSCFGVITPWNTSLPCKPDKRDHRQFWVGVITFGSVKPILENVAVQHQRVFSADCDEEDPYCESDWAVVPEPITMVLIGTGLAGIGGVAALRRRRENEIETE